MIPKKRYMFSHQYVQPQDDQNDYYSQMLSYPLQEQTNQVVYSASDVSVAMILATGMGRADDPTQITERV